MLAACTGTPHAFVVRNAAIDSGMLTARMQWNPEARVLQALDNGIALQFDITVSAQGDALLGWHKVLLSQTRHLQLRYFPLSRQYQLRDLDLDQTRSYAARALAFAGIEDLRVPLKDWNVNNARSYRLQIALNRDALPGALRLPALFLPAWRLCRGEFSWPAQTG